MIYGSVCSGIEAASVAWHPLGWRAAFVSEIEKFPRAVLQTRWPNIPLHGDFTTIAPGHYEPIELLVGGTPCQSFSVAGLRGGLADDRGNLALEFLRLAQRLRPRWLVWENVPGVLSSGGGRDFGAILGGLVELGYGFAYRILDAQHFGVPQRRRRVFVVGYLGDWRRAAAVLFERHSLSGNPPPRRETRERITSILEAGARTGKSTDDPRAGIGISQPGDPMFTLQSGKQHAVAFGGNNTNGPIDVATACNAHGGPSGRMDFESETFVTHSLRADGFDASEDGTGRGTPLVPVAFNITPSNSNKDYNARQSIRAQAVTAGGNRPSARGGDLIAHCGVRRLTPTECEALQGFPRNYTLIEYRGKPAADGPRYKALGNSFAVPVVRWIGERIQSVENIFGNDSQARISSAVDRSRGRDAA